MATQSKSAKQIVPPSIERVVDSELNAVPNGSDTEDYRFTLSGTVEVEGNAVLGIFDNGYPRANVFPQDDGTWSGQLDVVSVGEHRFTAQVYGESVESEPWLINVLGWNRPVIESVIDSQGAPVADGSTTEDRQFTLSGTVVEHTVLAILDNGSIIANAFSKDDYTWSVELRLDTAGSHRFTAQSRINGAESEPWTVNVSGWNKPVIESVVDSQGTPVSDGSTTEDPQLTLMGTVVEREMLAIFDNGNLWQYVVPNEDCTWGAEFRVLTAGSHRFTALTPSNNSESEPWTVILKDPAS